MKRFFLIMIALMLPALAACNTVEGVGKDVQKGGEGLENAAQNYK